MFNDEKFMESVLKKRVLDLVDENIQAMIKYKGEGNSNMEVWNKSQSYYGKTLSLAFGNSLLIFSRLLLVFHINESFERLLIKYKRNSFNVPKVMAFASFGARFVGQFGSKKSDEKLNF